MGCWTETAAFAIDSDSGSEAPQWRAELIAADGSAFRVYCGDDTALEISWAYCGLHNVENALVAIAAARHVGVPPVIAARALGEFRGVKRRLELLGCVAEISVYDDFAHHPTAIEMTLQGLRARCGTGRLIALIEPRSNTMRMGQHRDNLAAATAEADRVFWFQPPGMDWSLDSVIAASTVPATLCEEVDELVQAVIAYAQPGDQVVIMSNGSFSGVHQKLLDQLNKS
jgi:UDP-N-acetylmuramate: L-alanyl-gamma-D-glutamyl-meso-diaminopimelate ligase